MADDFSPLETIHDARRFWWLLAVCMIAGGLFGLLFHALRPPLYEASVAFSLGIDYSRTGPMNQYDEDMALGMAGNLIYSDAVMQQVSSAAAQQNISISPADLRSSSSIERKLHVWIVRVRHPDPHAAASLANLWADEAMRQLKDAYQHSLAKEALERYAVTLETCLQNLVPALSAPGGCSLNNLPQIQADLAKVQADIMLERQGAKNIFPGLLFEDVLKAQVPSQPVLYGRASLVLAGMLIGFLIGVAGVQAGAGRWLRRSRV